MINPYKSIFGLQEFKGDLHVHTDLSDGIGSVDDMLKKVSELSFDFCCIADHDLPGPSSYFRDRLLVLSGQELSDDNGHIVAISSSIDRAKYETTLDQLRAVKRSGGFSILSHPKIREFVTDQSLTYTASRLVNELEYMYDGVEIYTHNVGSGFKLAIDRLDVVWTAGLNIGGFEPVWAFANSDGHAIDHITKNVGIIVWAKNLEEKEILESIRKGCFYSLANTESRFSGFEITGNRLCVSAINSIMIRLVKSSGLPVKVVSSGNPERLSICYEIDGDEGYLRVEAMDINGNCAYLNPILVR